MSERFEQMAAERDALYQATWPVEGTRLALALYLDREAARLQEQADKLRRRRAGCLSYYREAPDNGH